MLARFWRLYAFRGCAVALMLVFLGITCAAGAGNSGKTALAPGTSQQAEKSDELDEVVVDGQKASAKPSEIRAWIRRLIGEFTYEGHVDVNDRGNSRGQLPVQGQGTCAAFGSAPGVLCNVSVVWPEAKQSDGGEIPGDIPSWNPATILYGFESNFLIPNDYQPVVDYMIVGNNGIAEPARGRLYGDTLISKEPCMNTPGNCRRITRIHAPPDGKVIEMQIDVEQESRTIVNYRLVMRRTAQAPK